MKGLKLKSDVLKIGVFIPNKEKIKRLFLKLCSVVDSKGGRFNSARLVSLPQWLCDLMCFADCLPATFRGVCVCVISLQMQAELARLDMWSDSGSVSGTLVEANARQHQR